MTGTSQDFVRGFSLDSILTLIEMNQETWTLKIRSEGRVGYLYFEDGEIIEAEVQELKGDKAAIELISWDDAEIRIIKSCNKPRRIQSSIMGLLLEGKRIMDEAREERDLEAKRCEEAVAHIEAIRFNMGQEILVRILNKNPRFHKGWLWYSRTIGTMQGIGSAIDRALRLAPEDREIVEEKEKFIKARSSVKDERVKRCPFCWTPLNLNDLQCAGCGLHLIISKASLVSSNGKGDLNVIDESVKRFSRVLEREKNLYASYYMAISHFNMNELDRTLELLNDTVVLAGEQKFFSDQLNLYLNWMASRKAAETKMVETVEHVDTTGDGKTILVVEDSATTRKIIAMTLLKMGYRIIEAVDGLEALSKLSEERPDLMLLDIILPKMNGYEILSIIKNKREFKNLPVIMLTSRDGFMSRMKGKMAGTAAYLTKPFNPAELLRTINKHI